MENRGGNPPDAGTLVQSSHSPQSTLFSMSTKGLEKILAKKGGFENFCGLRNRYQLRRVFRRALSASRKRWQGGFQKTILGRASQRAPDPSVALRPMLQWRGGLVEGRCAENPCRNGTHETIDHPPSCRPPAGAYHADWLPSDATVLSGRPF